jgi:hypothetical protein
VPIIRKAVFDLEPLARQALVVDRRDGDSGVVAEGVVFGLPRDGLRGCVGLSEVVVDLTDYSGNPFIPPSSVNQRSIYIKCEMRRDLKI